MRSDQAGGHFRRNRFPVAPNPWKICVWTSRLTSVRMKIVHVTNLKQSGCPPALPASTEKVARRDCWLLPRATSSFTPMPHPEGHHRHIQQCDTSITSLRHDITMGVWPNRSAVLSVPDAQSWLQGSTQVSLDYEFGEFSSYLEKQNKKKKTPNTLQKAWWNSYRGAKTGTGLGCTWV